MVHGRSGVKIAIVTQYYAPEAIRIPDTLARQLVRRGHEVRVVTGYPNYPDGKLFANYTQRWRHTERKDGVKVRRVPLLISHSYNPIARFANYLSFAINAALAYNWVRSADVVYVYATQMTPAIGPSLWRLIFRLPYVMHVQDLWPESVTGSSMAGGGAAKEVIGALLNPWLRYLYRTAAATIAIAPSMARMLVERGVPQDRIHTVLNWAASESETAPVVRSRANEHISIVYAGNLGDHQSLDTVIEAANAVKHLTRLRVTIVGSGVAEARLRKLALSLDAHNVTFKGRVAPEEMGQIHANSDFQIISLKDLEIFEGTIPSKLQASLANAIPVITTVRGDVKRLVEDNGIGFACDPEDADQLARAFEKAAALNPRQREQMGALAVKYYKESMSIDRGVSQIEGILTTSSRASKGKGRWT
jgi:glycosyltransferase involved in cell wall biosynthesis